MLFKKHLFQQSSLQHKCKYSCDLLGYVHNHSSVDIWGRTFLCCGGCPVHCKLLAAFLVSTLLMPVGTPYPQYDNQKCLQIMPNAP